MLLTNCSPLTAEAEAVWFATHGAGFARGIHELRRDPSQIPPAEIGGCRLLNSRPLQGSNFPSGGEAEIEE